MTESQLAATTSAAYLARQRPRKYALVSSGGSGHRDCDLVVDSSRFIEPRATKR
jgi:hypothetical protein